MLSAVLVFALAADPVQVAIPRLSLSEVPAERGVALVDYFAEQLGQGGEVRVTTASEVQAILGNERQKELLGCGDTSCLAELTAALGAEYLVIGSVAKAGTEIVATLKCIAATDGAVRGAWSTRAVSDEQLLDFFGATAGELRALLAPERPRSAVRFLPMIVGAAALATGAALFVHAVFQHQRLVKGDPAIDSLATAESFAASGRSIETTAWLLSGIGVALVAGGLAFAMLAPERDVRIGAAWVNGPFFALAGRLP